MEGIKTDVGISTDDDTWVVMVMTACVGTIVSEGTRTDVMEV